MNPVLPWILLTLVVSLPLNAESTRWHPLEKYCVTREATGMMSGKTVECSCDWGNKRFEVQETVMKVGSVSIPTHQHLIQIGSQVTTYDPNTRRGTVIQVPDYEEFLESVEGRDAMENMRAMVESTGGIFTDKKKEIAGEICEVVNNPSIGDMCISQDGIVLEMITLDGAMTQVATSFDTSTCGDMSNYDLPADVIIADAPDMSSILEQLEQMHQSLPSE